jgi:hypothetical protein
MWLELLFLGSISGNEKARHAGLFHVVSMKNRYLTGGASFFGFFTSLFLRC